MSPLGRGRSHLSFDQHTVTKHVTNAWEPLYMRRFPDVFVEVHDIKHLSFTMKRLQEPDYNEPHTLLEASSSLKLLWNTPWRGSDKDWREKLRTHLYDLGFVAKPHIDDLIQLLPDVNEPVLIHGDPTLANLLQGPDGYFWIDPLLRAYIPGDPHVDLGKMFQSCLGYEQVLLGNHPLLVTKTEITQQRKLMHDLANLHQLDYNIGLTWCVVHFIRLIPYQVEKDRDVFGSYMIALLNEVLSS